MRSEPIPLEDVADELRTLREKGLIKARQLPLPVLNRAAREAGVPERERRPVEVLLRRAAEAFGDSDDGQAVHHLFGLFQGAAGHPTKDLRERAAGVYDRSPETFRKGRERLLIERLAEEILILCEQVPPPGATVRAEPVGLPAEYFSGDVGQALRHLEQRLDDPAWTDAGYGPFPVVSGGSAEVRVWIGDIVMLRDCDIVVSSENVYLQPSHTFAATLSGSLRKAAIRRDQHGPVDVVAGELARWRQEHSPEGGPVEPGTVVVTSAGELERVGVRRLFHAAVATPRPGTNSYDLSRGAVQFAVTRIFELARAERAREPGLRSISLPLFGAGRGGLSAGQSFGWTWPALRSALHHDPTWQVQLTVRTPRSAAAVLHRLALDA